MGYQRRASAILHEDIYPQLDAVGAGLLTFYQPRGRSSQQGAYYTLACPACGAHEAYYYPGSGRIHCNRREACGASTPIWDAVQRREPGTRNGEILQRLANAAGVKLEQEPNTSPEARALQGLRTSLQELLQAYLKNTPEAWAYLTETRGFSAEDIEREGFGFFPDAKTVKRDLHAAGIDEASAVERGVLPDPQRRSGNGWMLDQRITVIWPQPEHGWHLAARRIDGGKEKKYVFSPGADLSLPLGLRRTRERIWGVEGFFDKAAMETMGVPAMACGGNAVNHAQAAHLAAEDYHEIGFVTDAGTAGMDGGFKTVERCESLGVVTYIASIPEGQDDPDAMRRNGRTQAFRELLQHAGTGGAYTARLLVTAYHKRPGRRAETLRRARDLRTKLTLASRADFDAIWRRYAVRITHESSDAVRLMADLQAAGLDESRAVARVQELTGVTIQVSTAESGTR